MPPGAWAGPLPQTGQVGENAIPVRAQINPLLCIQLNRGNTDQVTPGGGRAWTREGG